MKKFFKLFISVGACFLAGAVGSAFTSPAIGEWYKTINKPFFNPPDWLFTPVWMVLYAMMGVALFLAWERGFKGKESKIALIFFVAQLILNAFWSIVFFGMKSPFWALIIIGALWILICLTIFKFLKISKQAGILLLPYIV